MVPMTWPRLQLITHTSLSLQTLVESQWIHWFQSTLSPMLLNVHLNSLSHRLRGNWSLVLTARELTYVELEHFVSCSLHFQMPYIRLTPFRVERRLSMPVSLHLSLVTSQKLFTTTNEIVRHCIFNLTSGCRVSWIPRLHIH